MKTLVVYYSLSGNTKFIGDLLAKKTNADVLEIKTKKEIKKTGFMKYFWGGKQVFMKEEPEIFPYTQKPEAYDLIIVGTPVWAWTYAPPLKTFFSQNRFKNKKILLFGTCGGNIGKTFEDMKKALEGNLILGTIDFFEPLQNQPEKNQEKALFWIQNFL